LRSCYYYFFGISSCPCKFRQQLFSTIVVVVVVVVVALFLFVNVRHFVVLSICRLIDVTVNGNRNVTGKRERERERDCALATTTFSIFRRSFANSVNNCRQQSSFSSSSSRSFYLLTSTTVLLLSICRPVILGNKRSRSRFCLRFCSADNSAIISSSRIRKEERRKLLKYQ